MATYRVTFLPAGVTVEVSPEQYPLSREGRPGSLLDIAAAHGIDVPSACGGAGVCGTCHVIVVAGMENLSEATDEELDAVERRPNNTTQSRLACQAVVRGDVTVRLAD